jgi:hypothetical protein
MSRMPAAAVGPEDVTTEFEELQVKLEPSVVQLCKCDNTIV